MQMMIYIHTIDSARFCEIKPIYDKLKDFVKTDDEYDAGLNTSEDKNKASTNVISCDCFCY